MADLIAIAHPDEKARRLARGQITPADVIATIVRDKGDEAGGVQTYDELAPGWTVVLRRQPVRLVEGRPEGGYTDAYELVCCDCGDEPDLDYRDASPWLQRIRGPYGFSAGIAAYGRHVRLRHGQQPIPAAGGARRRTGPVDGQTG
jgi:hypothetical protein